MFIKILHVLSLIQVTQTTSFWKQNGLLLCTLFLVTEIQTTMKPVRPVQPVSTKTAILPLDPLPGMVEFTVRFYLDR
jgi:hypothetical protein